MRIQSVLFELCVSCFSPSWRPRCVGAHSRVASSDQKTATWTPRPPFMVARAVLPQTGSAGAWHTPSTHGCWQKWLDARGNCIQFYRPQTSLYCLSVSIKIANLRTKNDSHEWEDVYEKSLTLSLVSCTSRAASLWIGFVWCICRRVCRMYHLPRLSSMPVAHDTAGQRPVGDEEWFLITYCYPKSLWQSISILSKHIHMTWEISMWVWFPDQNQTCIWSGRRFFCRIASMTARWIMAASDSSLTSRIWSKHTTSVSLSLSVIVSTTFFFVSSRLETYMYIHTRWHCEVKSKIWPQLKVT